MISSSRFDFDLLRLYFMRPYTLRCSITIKQPTVGDIVDYGETAFYSMLSVFTSNPTSYRLQLWNEGIDWNKIKDFELFATLSKALSPQSTDLLFGDTVDFTKFEIVPVESNGSGDDPESVNFVLRDPARGLTIDEYGYFELADYLRTMFNIWPKIEKASRKSTKQSIIEEERIDLAYRKKQGIKQQSVLLPLISACLNHPGFKYNAKELEAVGIYQFMDSVRRISAYESTVALLHGQYSGFADLSKIERSKFDLMRDLTVNK